MTVMQLKPTRLSARTKSCDFRFVRLMTAARARRGSVLIYSFFLMVIMLAVISLGVDYGRMQLIKTELQRDADATARGALQLYANDGSSVATVYAPMMASNTYNPVDANSGVQPKITVTWGSWNAASKIFTAGGGTPIAVQVTVSRTTQNGNPVALTFPLINGLSEIRTNCDVSATAIAVLQPAATSTSYVPATADLWLAGMPLGSTAHSGQDTEANDAPILALNVTPGTTISVSASGTAYYNQQNSSNGGPDGVASQSYWNQFFNGGSGCQNGIQTINAPANALLGVFLNGTAPGSQTPPASGLDYSTYASQTQNGFNALQVQQPFFIGDGISTGSIVQSFLVPPGATRLYLATYDPNNNSDNMGGFNVTTTQQAQVYLVK